jgi:hypothetical protein
VFLAPNNLEPAGALGTEPQNQYDRVMNPSIWNLIWSKKKHTFRGQEGENENSEL